MNIEIISLFSLIIVLLYGLVKSADLIEDAFVFLAKSLKINEFFIGFVILSIVSSLPEFSIVLSSNKLVPELSVGNLMGGTLILLTLVIGASVIKFGKIEFKGKFREKEVAEGLFVMFLSVFTLLDGVLEVYEGLFLMSVYALYVFVVFSRYKSKSKVNSTPSYVNAKKLMQMLAKSVFGSVLILVCSSLLVDVVIEIGSKIQINEALIGLFVLALGTNLPELTILFRARKVQTRNLAIGNFIGSATFNTFILGLLAVLSQGINLVDGNDIVVLIPVLLILSMTLVAFLLFSWTGRSLNKQEGIILIGFYASLVITELILILFNLKG